MRPQSVLLEERASIIDAIRRHLEERQEIIWAYLHGSFLEGGPYRDIDLAVWVEPTQGNFQDWRRYELNLSVTLHLSVSKPVDVRVLNDAPLAFRYHAMRGQPLLVRDRERLDEVRARTWDDYFDFLPFARRYLREVLSA
jgi:predicted nucleotidyltransferase